MIPIYTGEDIKFANDEEASAYYMKKLRQQSSMKTGQYCRHYRETVTGSNGLFVPPKGYLKGLREIVMNLAFF